jgi:hypothetical protein
MLLSKQKKMKIFKITHIESTNPSHECFRGQNLVFYCNDTDNGAVLKTSIQKFLYNMYQVNAENINLISAINGQILNDNTNIMQFANITTLKDRALKTNNYEIKMIL